MRVEKWLLVIVILVGGICVLSSYAFGSQSQSGGVDILWGGVPQAVWSLYTIGMILAAVGYFFVLYFILFCLNPTTTRVAGRYGFPIFLLIFTLVLIPSALWMPLTSLAIEQSSQFYLWLVRLVLWVVAAASLGLLYALLTIEPRIPRWAHWFAVMGSLAFCLQTVVLDAIVWVSMFSI